MANQESPRVTSGKGSSDHCIQNADKETSQAGKSFKESFLIEVARS